MHKKILLLGTTGIKKTTIAQNIAKALTDNHGHDKIRIINFEKECFPISSHFYNMPHFLTSVRSVQHQIWNDAWKQLSATFVHDTDSNEITILILHAVYVNDGYGVRSIINVHSVCNDFSPTLIITLLDDIYNLWGRTELHANGDINKGRPTIEQLLMARRNETTIGDLLAFQNPLKMRTKHMICSINHPLQTILNLIVFDSKIIYISFPISEPLRMARDGDNSFVQAINKLDQLTVKRNSHNVVFISPLAIDELPLCFDAIPLIKEYENQTPQKNGTPTVLKFNRKKRWNISELWGECELLSDGTDTLPEEIEIPITQLVDVHGMIKTDIGWRDYKLVDQANALCIFCPIPPNRDDVTRGVMGEWQKAITESMPCYVYQEEAWGKDKRINSLTNDAGSMGTQPLNSASLHVKTTEELLMRCENL